jgi:pimeloyl-ACP methyl ester carboxylesterase
MADIRFQSLNCGEVALHVADAGPASGPPVILLHGFPEFWFGWRHQIHALADAGHHVIVPDQRGYNLSEKPRGVEAYDLDRLVSDIAGLANNFGAAQFSLVGHDWGAAVAWRFAEAYPERVRRLAVMDAPHPAIWRAAMDNDPEQRKLSRYVRLLGTRGLPELLIRAGRYRALEAPMRESTRPLSDEELVRYREAWTQQGALTGMINWYRAILRWRPAIPAAGSIGVPTQIVWGGRDRYALARLAEASRDLCRRGNLTSFPNATHWIQHDESERVNAILLEFLK